MLEKKQIDLLHKIMMMDNPSIRELAKATGRKVPNIHASIAVLERAGHLKVKRCIGKQRNEYQIPFETIKKYLTGL